MEWHFDCANIYFLTKYNFPAYIVHTFPLLISNTATATNILNKPIYITDQNKTVMLSYQQKKQYSNSENYNLKVTLRRRHCYWLHQHKTLTVLIDLQSIKNMSSKFTYLTVFELVEVHIANCLWSSHIIWNRHGHECSRIWKLSGNFTLIQCIKKCRDFLGRDISGTTFY